ncbi:transporter [Candidatus Poribacteria bacterium]|nr:transporter [Candidatus Poribacteria bacterium]
MKKHIGFILAITLICFAAPVYALNQPLAINLGATNFIDGASPGPGWYFTEYIQVISADEIKGGDGHTLIDNANLDAIISLNQIIYQSNIQFLGGNPGIDVIVPFADIDVDPPLSSQDGLSDVYVGPFIQWGPHMIFGRPYFHRFEFQVIMPTGENDEDNVLNAGGDVWALDPYYTFTYFITPKLTTSLRFHYLWTSENDNRAPALDVQAGQAIHFNYAVDYAVTDSLRLGIAGYYLKQLEEDDFDGGPPGIEDDTEEEVFAIGPGLVWHINPALTLMGAINFESAAEMRPEGVRSTLRLIWKFK